ncbi:hypothetical protein [Edaphobacter albus]|uniref:hypothetical protein n=1 Tax=Edaphobacter sp. 4G125 TaxID=2763071 RepID=UPI001644CC62|nr:hypothetical protein [Edaphobacter sp. 4G125]QNI35498.1 hypothetical protein H7846_10455 [Edaphobacter sp. 4G125]
MATTVVSFLKHDLNQVGTHAEPSRQRLERRYVIWFITALTALAFFIHGYHPFAEDGGLYLTGVKKSLTPDMYPHETGFVLGHLRFSVFGPTLASLVRFTGIKLEVIVLLAYLASIWTMLWAAWLLADRCFQGWQRVGAVTLFATWLTLPVAGTSLMVMDPYVTARSISTPCVLLAIVFALDLFMQRSEDGEHNIRPLLAMGATLLLAAIMHPLMAIYGFGCILALGSSLSRRKSIWFLATVTFCVAAVAAAALLSRVMQPETANYRLVAMTRYYWFLNQWHWYEWLGLAGPLAILAFAGFKSKKLNETAQTLARMCVTAGLAAILVALIFARPDSPSLLIARLQPLRIFQTLYIVMTLYVGAWLSTYLRQKRTLWIAAFSLFASIMFFVQRQTFPASAHIELFQGQQQNGWAQAFTWIRSNTPKDALFALDADYITKPGEDAQSFRAIAERSALPDYSKDGGEASITPSLADQWTVGQKLQERLSEQNDAEKISELSPMGVQWVVLTKGASTGLTCPYINSAVKVCQLQAEKSSKAANIISNKQAPRLSSTQSR